MPDCRNGGPQNSIPNHFNPCLQVVKLAAFLLTGVTNPRFGKPQSQTNTMEAWLKAACERGKCGLRITSTTVGRNVCRRLSIQTSPVATTSCLRVQQAEIIPTITTSRPAASET